MSRKHRKSEDREIRYGPIGPPRTRYGGRAATNRHRRLCERHGHRLGLEIWYAGFSHTYGGDWHSTSESGRVRHCTRCHEPFYFNVTMSQTSNIVAWSDPVRDEWQPDPDEWKGEATG